MVKHIHTLVPSQTRVHLLCSYDNKHNHYIPKRVGGVDRPPLILDTPNEWCDIANRPSGVQCVEERLEARACTTTR